MNLERFHTIISAAKNQAEADSLQKRLQTMINHLQSQINEPANADHQKNLARARQSFLDVLEKSESQSFPPSWDDILISFDLDYLLAYIFEREIEDSFTGNEITPQITLEKLNKILSKLTNNIDACTNILSGFENLRVQKDDLAPGECEISITIPREHVNSHASALGEEFKAIEKIMKPFAEMATGSAQTFEVRTISASDFTLVLMIGGAAAAPLTAALTVKAIAEATKAIISVYKEVVEVRLMAAKLKKMEVDEKARDKTTSALEDLVKTHIDKGIKKEAARINRELSKIKDSGRKNEIKIHIEKSMFALASRIDHGFDIETRMGELPPPPEPVEPKEGEEANEPVPESPETIAMRDAQMKIEAAHMAQIGLVREGEPILALPKPANDDGPDE